MNSKPKRIYESRKPSSWAWLKKDGWYYKEENDVWIEHIVKVKNGLLVKGYINEVVSGSNKQWQEKEIKFWGEAPRKMKRITYKEVIILLL